MIKLRDGIQFIVASRPGITDRELSEMTDASRSVINTECRGLEQAGKIIRRSDGYAVRNLPGPALGIVRNRRGRVTGVF